MKKTISALIFISACVTHQVQSAEALEQRISLRQFKGLAHYAAEYLKENHEILLFEMNESGFVRVKVPVSGVEKAQGVTKVRLNYWRPGSKMDGNNHSHPSYFESFVVNGGYRHSLYEPGGDEPFTHFRINRLREATDEGEVCLHHLGNQDTHAGEAIVYDKSVIPSHYR